MKTFRKKKCVKILNEKNLWKIKRKKTRKKTRKKRPKQKQEKKSKSPKIKISFSMFSNNSYKEFLETKTFREGIRYDDYITETIPFDYRTIFRISMQKRKLATIVTVRFHTTVISTEQKRVWKRTLTSWSSLQTNR